MSGYIINECEFLISQNEMRQHLKDMHNSINQNFPSDKYMTLQNHAKIKRFILSAKHTNGLLTS